MSSPNRDPGSPDEVRHLSPDTSPALIAEALAVDGAVIVDRLVDPATIDTFFAEMEPWIAATPHGADDFAGRFTRRTGGLIARSPTARELVSHPLVTGTVDLVLGHLTTYQLHLTQVIEIGPGNPAQVVHRDQWAFDFFPFPSGYEVQCNTIWAGDDFTADNGATRLVPRSHLMEDRLRLDHTQTVPAEMEKGSVLLYTGSLYHSGGENRTDRPRRGINITYSAGFLRQEENQYLSVPPETARKLPESLLRLMGYRRGAYALGYVDDLRDPLDVLLGRDSRSEAGFSPI